MKNSLLTVCLSLFAVGATAQHVEISDFQPRNFTGIKSNVNKDIFYTDYLLKSVNNDDSVVIKLYNRELMEMSTVGLSVSKSMQLVGYTFTNEFLVLLFNDPVKKSRTTYVLNMQGNVMAQNTEENIKAELLETANAPLVFSANPREFVMLQKSGNGYTLESMDSDLKSKWTKSFSGEGESWEIVQTLTAMDKLYLLRKETATNGKYSFSIQAISLNEGHVAFTVPLKSASNGYPVFMQMNEDMGISTAGVYLKNSKSNEKPDGIFFTSLDLNGKITQQSELPWDILKSQLPENANNPLLNGKTNVMIQAILPAIDRSGNILIAETYHVNGSDKATTFNVGDLVAYHLHADGRVISVNKIEKAQRKLTIKNTAASDFELATQMYRNGYFSYRSIIADRPDKQYIVYKSEEEKKVKLYFQLLSDTSKANVVSDELGSVQNGPKVIELNAAFSNPELYQNVIPLSHGRIMLYSYEDNRLTLKIQPTGAN